MKLDKHDVAYRQKGPALKKFLKKLRQKPPKNLDSVVQTLDEEVFDTLDCLECANCCKTISPIFTQKDVERIASGLSMKPGRFVSDYLHIDDEMDYVLNETPCPFLGEDNYCSIYEIRPKACREYPHTAQRKFHSRIQLTMKNLKTCPAVFEIVTKMEEDI